MQRLESDESEVEILPNTDQTECAICAECYIRRNPRILPCAHTFCSYCLERYALSKKVKLGDKISCPTCKNEVEWPRTGSVGFPKNNYFVERKSGLEGATAVSVIVSDEPEQEYAVGKYNQNFTEDIANSLKDIEHYLKNVEFEKFKILSKVQLCRLSAIAKIDQWVKETEIEIKDK